MLTFLANMYSPLSAQFPEPSAMREDQESVASVLFWSLTFQVLSCETLDKDITAHAETPSYSSGLRSSWGLLFHFLSTPVSPHLVDML